MQIPLKLRRPDFDVMDDNGRRVGRIFRRHAGLDVDANRSS